MASLRGLYGKRDDGGVESNFGVDYVVNYKIPAEERAEAEASFVQLVEALGKVGLTTEVRRGTETSLLVFVKIASTDLLAQHVYRGRLQDWLHGVRASSPDKDMARCLEDEPVTEAERSRLIYMMITKPQDEGGAGVVPGAARWRFVDSVFPLHNHAFNKAWIKQWSSKYLLDQDDLDDIRNKFGEEVAFYFAFLRSYFRFLILPAAVGFGAWMFLGQFSTLYALLSCLWSVVFFEYWKKKEVDLAVLWGVRGVSNIQHARPEFNWDDETEDPVTGETVKVFSPIKRIRTQLLQVPFATACILTLGGLVVACNSLEVFINEVYNGGGKMFLALIPTIILCTLTPAFSAVLMQSAKILTDWENYQNTDAYNAALIQKQFVLNFMTSYMALFFTAFVYTPFGHILIPFLEFWHKTAQVVTFSEKPLPIQAFEINPERISKQMFFFTVTAQIVNFATEVIVPYVQRRAVAKAKAQFKKTEDVGAKDHAEEADFLKRVRDESELEAYDVSGDYREMVIQYGYLSLFSVAWPLAACCFLVNNWVELRSDAVKIAVGSRRPIPWRSDSIGPWLTAIGFLSWLGSVTSSAIVYLCRGAKDGSRGSTSHITLAGFLLSVALAEHFYFAVQLAVRYVMGKLESPGLQKERKERFLMRKQLIEETLSQNVTGRGAMADSAESEKISRESLEEDARKQSTMGHGTPEEIFWQRQRSIQETVSVGRKIIQEIPEEKKSEAEKPAASPRA